MPVWKKPNLPGKRWHAPITDQLIAAGMPEEFISAATDRLAQINHAYQTLAGQIRARTA